MAIICLSGKIGSGKTTAANILIQTFGLKKLSFAEHVIAPEIIKDSKLVNRKNLQIYGSKLLSEFGEKWMINQLMKDISGDANYVIDDVRYTSTAEFFKKRYNAILLHIATDCNLRYDRVKLRKKEAIRNIEDFEEIDNYITEKEIDLIAEISDYVINNNNNIESLKVSLDEVLCKIL